jgi:hypothetical protein
MIVLSFPDVTKDKPSDASKAPMLETVREMIGEARIYGR